jgi:hypothetical protein
MREPRPPLSGGSVTEASAGAVKHDRTDPLGTRISDPLRELGSLQEQMRARREQAEAATLSAATAEAAPAVADLVPAAEMAAPEPLLPGEAEALQADAAREPAPDDAEAAP